MSLNLINSAGKKFDHSSDIDSCVEGLTIEMTVLVPKEAQKMKEVRYILDSGASTFNSRGVSMYMLNGKLRSDIAMTDQALCLETPITYGRWMDIILTWKEGQGKRY